MNKMEFRCESDGNTHFLPTMTRTASCIIERASSSTESGKVALNKEQIIEGFEQALTTESICSTNPSSNSLSDSSKTRYSTLQQATNKGLNFLTKSLFLHPTLI